MMPYTDEEVTAAAAELVRFYGDDANRIAAMNVGMRDRTLGWKHFWLAVWKRIQ